MTLLYDPKVVWNLFVEIQDELNRATGKFGKFNSAHEGYAVILEELDELWSSVRQNEPDREEAIQVAAMAVRFVLDICSLSQEDTP